MRKSFVSKQSDTGNRWFIKWGIFSLLLLISAISGTLSGLALVYSVDLSQVRDLEVYRPIANTELYDDQGQIIGSFALQRRVVAQYKDYPPVLYNAIIAIEDRDFESHIKITAWRILRAAYRDVTLGASVQGGSTLTMQLARNLFLSPQRTYRCKIEEILLAIQIEHHFSKEQIFTLYANQIYLGHGIYGFDTGAEYYFSKRAKELTVEELTVEELTVEELTVEERHSSPVYRRRPITTHPFETRERRYVDEISSSTLCCKWAS
jgi:penicillin-binding protein 1A